MRLRRSMPDLGETQAEVTPKAKKSKAKAASAMRPPKVATPAPQDETPVSKKKSKKRKSGIVVEDKEMETDLSVKESSPPDETHVSKKKSKKRKSGIVVEDKEMETDLSVKESSPPKKQKKSTKVTQPADQNGTVRSGGEAKVEGKSPSKKKKQQQAAAVTPAVQSGNRGTLAIGYLHLWKKSKSPGGAQWRFQKIRQVWLLQNMLDSDQISEEDFATLLEYLKGLLGKSRTLTTEKMESLIQELDDKMQSPAEEAEDGKDSLKKMKIKWKRASSVLQTLT